MHRIGIHMLIAFCIILNGCDGGNNQNVQDSGATNNLDVLPEEETSVAEIIYMFPTPLEISYLIKKSGADYKSGLIAEADLNKQPSTSYKQALNLGVHGADLGYINAYGMVQDNLSNIEAVQNIASDLNVSQYFDFNKMIRKAKEQNNLDSILHYSAVGFDRMDKELMKEDRQTLTLLILIGGWIESLYLATSVAELSKDNQELIERIGEQKILLETLLGATSPYQKDPRLALLYENLESLNKLYEEVTIEYTFSEPEVVEQDGMLVVIDKSSSEVLINPEALKLISKKISQIRADITI